MLKDFTQEKFDIIIQAGQSNSEGTACGPVDRPYEINDRVWYLNGNFTISLAQEVVWENETVSNFALSFARDYMEKGLLQEDRKLLILRTAVGGTGFLDNRWKMTDDLYLRMMEMIGTALDLNKENRLVAFLWHQGETDALLNASREVHYNHLSTLLDSVCTTFDVPKIPFIAGDFVQDWKSENMAISKPVIEAIKDVCTKYPYGAFVETDGLKTNRQENNRITLGWPEDDPIHFSRRAIYELGCRYFAAYQEILSR